MEVATYSPYPRLAYLAFKNEKPHALEGILDCWADDAMDMKERRFYADSLHMRFTYRGLIALRSGDHRRAALALLKSAKVPRSPTLSTFGPNMLLAKAVLETGNRRTVVTYLNDCRSFWYWPFRIKPVTTWKRAIARGEVPDFLPNLIYHTGQKVGRREALMMGE